ncbi:hypothetical protein BBta_4240 [Bradyrhizobium sp. BTAi1]|nr:hypothetical protein BBta_4240 [Bradyrhizobium sp. BTAi1]
MRQQVICDVVDHRDTDFRLIAISDYIKITVQISEVNLPT